MFLVKVMSLLMFLVKMRALFMFLLAPGPVSSVHLADTASHNLVVEWKPPAEANGEIVKYVVTYEPGKHKLKGLLNYDRN